MQTMTCYRQTCTQIITGRNLKYRRALKVIQNEEYLMVTDLEIIRRLYEGVGFKSNSILFLYYFLALPQKHCKLFSGFQIPNVRLWELRWIIEFDLNLYPKGIARKYSKKLKVRRRKKRQTSSSSSRYTTPLFSEPLTYYTNSKITIGGNNNNLLGRFSFI